jgi:hypothetical protein
MEQLILHLIGDYITQSDWMAQNKTKRAYPALAHAIVYSLPFLLLGPSWLAFWVILGTHFLIDRYRLARFVVYAKNIALGNLIQELGEVMPNPKKDLKGCDEWIATQVELWRQTSWRNCKDTGYPSERPAWLAVWLLIAADNTLHLAINYCAISWL